VIALVGALHDEDEALADLASSALIKIGRPAARPLLNVVRSGTPVVSDRARTTLKNIAGNTAELVTSELSANAPDRVTGQLTSAIRRVTGALPNLGDALRRATGQLPPDAKKE